MKEENKRELLEKSDFLEQPENNKKDELMKERVPKEEEKEKEKGVIKKDFEDEEKKKLLIEEMKELNKEKKSLIRIINRLKRDLDSKDFITLGEIYEQYLNNEDMTKRKIKDETTRKSLCAMFYFVSPLFCIINLMGVFQSISILKIIAEILKNSIKNYFKSLFKPFQIESFSINDYIKEYEYYSMLNNDTKKETFDFSLTMFMAFLGDAFLKAKGFRISFSVLAVLNIGAMVLISNFSFEDYDHDENTYSLFKMLYILLIWLLLFIGVGASALLSQQIIIDSNYKYDEYIEEINKKSKEKFKKIKIKMKKKKQGKGKHKEIQGSDYKEELNFVKDFELFPEEKEQKESDDQIKTDEQKEKEIKNDEHDKLTVNPEISLEFNEDNDKYKIKKKYTQEINIKTIAKDFYDIKNKDEYLIRSGTLTTSNVILDENEIEKRIHKKKSIKEDNKKKKKKDSFNSFFMVCITTILGYFLKYIVNISLIGLSSKYHMENMNHINFIINNQSIGKKCNQTELNITCIEEIFNEKNLSKTDSILFDSLINYISHSEYKNKPVFYNLIFIYILTLILSIILYSIFVCIFVKEKEKKDGNDKGNKYSVCEICGYTIYSEDIILEKSPKCECCQLLCCGTCQNCLNMVIGSVLCCLSNEDKKEINICKCSQCCDKNKINYKKKKEYFCYCYQAKRKQNWFNKFLTSDTQKKIFPYMLEYFYLQFLSIAFEYQNNKILGDDSFSKINFEKEKELYLFGFDDLKFFSIFIVTFFLFFYATLSFNTISNLIKSTDEDEDEEKDIKKDEKEDQYVNAIKQISEGILAGAHGILVLSGLFSLIVSALYLSNNYKNVFESQHLIFIPILMNKFYHFTLTFFCVSYSDQNKKFDVISGSTLISIYLSIWDLIISLIRDHSSEKALYIVQIIFSSLPSLVLLILILLLFFSGIFIRDALCKDRFEIYCCLFSFCLCFGGFWFNEKTYNKLFERKCECCKINCYYCFECCHYGSGDSYNCCNCCDCYLCCDCCDCCECYDCCGCCDCFYCCGDECKCNC